MPIVRSCRSPDQRPIARARSRSRSPNAGPLPLSASLTQRALCFPESGGPLLAALRPSDGVQRQPGGVARPKPARPSALSHPPRSDSRRPPSARLSPSARPRSIPARYAASSTSEIPAAAAARAGRPAGDRSPTPTPASRASGRF